MIVADSGMNPFKCDLFKLVHEAILMATASSNLLIAEFRAYWNNGRSHASATAPIHDGENIAQINMAGRRLMNGILLFLVFFTALSSLFSLSPSFFSIFGLYPVCVEIGMCSFLFYFSVLSIFRSCHDPQEISHKFGGPGMS